MTPTTTASSMSPAEMGKSRRKQGYATNTTARKNSSSPSWRKNLPLPIAASSAMHSPQSLRRPAQVWWQPSSSAPSSSWCSIFPMPRSTGDCSGISEEKWNTMAWERCGCIIPNLTWRWLPSSPPSSVPSCPPSSFSYSLAASPGLFSGYSTSCSGAWSSSAG